MLHNFVAWFLIILFVLACAGNVIQASRNMVSENKALVYFAFNGLCVVGIAYVAWG